MDCQGLYRIIMNKNIKHIENLPDDFKIPDKEILKLIGNLFEMIKDNNQLIQLLDKRIKILELRLKN
jgi:chaperonin cofactor prefoldin